MGTDSNPGGPGGKRRVVKKLTPPKVTGVAKVVKPKKGGIISRLFGKGKK